MNLLNSLFGPPSIESLIKKLESRSEPVRQSAAEELVRRGNVVVEPLLRTCWYDIREAIWVL